MYRDTISEATSVTNTSDLIAIEDCMRDIIFHSTLDWIPRDMLMLGARQAFEVCDAMDDLIGNVRMAPSL